MQKEENLIIEKSRENGVNFQNPELIMEKKEQENMFNAY